ncbi:LIM domain only protein 7 [Aplochiton taeniatus]
MEWREQSTVSCDEGFLEAQRWIEAVTKKTFGSNNFRSALENGVLLCDLINRIQPGIIQRVNRLSTPIAGLENINVFLKACSKLGLKEAQLFHPGDLQDLSTRVTVKRQETSRRLKNVLITLYWLGRKAQSDPSYDGPYLNLKAFEGLLGIALSKALEKSSSHRSRSSSVRDSGFGDSWYSEREELFSPRGRGGGHRREDSLDSLDSLGSRPHSISSDATLKGSSEGCSSDAEAESIFRMSDKDPLSYRRSLTVQPRTTSQFNQFLPTKDKTSGYVPAPLRKKRAERNEDNRRSWANPVYTEEDGTFSRRLLCLRETRAVAGAQGNGRVSQSSTPAALQWAYEYESGSDSDTDRPDPDLVHDDLASRRFHSSSPAPPTNFALPINPLEAGGVMGGGRGMTWPKVPMSASTPPLQAATCLSSSGSRNSSGAQQAPHHSSVRQEHQRPPSASSPLRQMYDNSDDSDADSDEVGYADPVQDDLYARKVGLSPLHAANAPHDKFLPKFWTPEEEVHIHKIKLGSQRRPWYKKIQGFSRKKSGSSSEDSECDISPWLSSAPSPSAPSPSHSHTPEGSAYASRPAGPRSIKLLDCDNTGALHTPPHTTPQTPSQQPLRLVRPPLVFSRMDPTSGPRLVKCESHPLLGRQDPLEPPEPYDGWDNLDPDLENDDMFARRTQAFHSNTNLAMMKTRVYGSLSPDHPYSSVPEFSIVTQPQPPGTAKTEVRLPDVELDDVVYRKTHPQQASERQRPLSEDHFTPMAIPEPWALPPSIQARLLCPPCPLTQEAHRDSPNQDQREEPPKTDDMLLRKLGLGSGMGRIQGQGSLGGPRSNQVCPSLPTSCSEGDLQKMQSIREASQLRYKKKLMVERLAFLLPRKRDSSDGSKSMSDILADPSIIREVRYEELQKLREKVQETDDQWQDDLTKWKNRRKSVNSDIVKKKEEREQIEQITFGSDRRAKTLKDRQTERKRTSIGSRLSSLSSLDQDVFEDPAPVPAPRTFPTRSYTIDVPYSSPTSSPEPPLRKERARTATSATIRAASPPSAEDVDIVHNLVDLSTTTSSSSSSSSSRSSSQRPVFNSYSSSLVPTERSTSPALRRSTSPTPLERNSSPVLKRSVSPAPTPAERSTSSAKTEWTSTTTSTSTLSSTSKVPEPSRPWASNLAESEAPSFGSSYKKPQFNSMEPKPPVVSQVSASLPRSYQRSDSARIASVVAPRPFGTQSTRLASLPRAYTMDYSYKSVKGETDTKNSAMPTRYSQFMTAAEKAGSPSSSAQSSNGEEEEEERSITPALSVSPVPPQVNAPAKPSPPKENTQGSYSDMRISLNQKPNSSRDFGFQADWDSTGAHITSIQPGSSAEMCQLLVGDEVLAVNTHKVADMSYVQWKASLDEALQQGSLVMDVRRHGNTHWERDQPSLPFKTHKTINLTSMDPPMLLGAPDTNTIKSSLDFTSRIPKETTLTTKEVPTRPIVDMSSNGVNGGFRDQPGTLRNKDSEPMSLKNLKRRSEFFEQGGSESAIADLAVPSIGPPSNRWSWDPEEERRRQETWQKEQDRLLQVETGTEQSRLPEAVGQNICLNQMVCYIRLVGCC